MTGVQTCALPICFPVTIRGLYVQEFINDCMICHGHIHLASIESIDFCICGVTNHNDAGNGVFYGLTQSGSGGGGGWPFGAGGNVGQMNYDDTIFTDYTYSVYSYTYNQQVGNVGETATKVIAVSNGGNPRINGASGGYFAETYTAGDGGCH